MLHFVRIQLEFNFGDDRLRQRDQWIGVASFRDGNGSRYPLVATIDAKTSATARLGVTGRFAQAKQALGVLTFA